MDEMSPPRGGDLSDASALSLAVRRLRTGDTPSPPGLGAPPMRSPPSELVPGGLGVLGRAHALHAATAGNGHLEPACVLSPRPTPGGISIRLGGKGNKVDPKACPPPVKLSEQSAPAAVQRI